MNDNAVSVKLSLCFACAELLRPFSGCILTSTECSDSSDQWWHQKQDRESIRGRSLPVDSVMSTQAAS